MPAIRGAAALLGHPCEGSRALDAGHGAADRLREAGVPGETATRLDAAPAESYDLVLTWPGPAHLPRDIRPAWWEMLDRLLAPGGVAAVRLDMLPGWHALTSVQDFARFHAMRHHLDLELALPAVLDLATDTLDEDEARWHGWLSRLRELRSADAHVAPDLTWGPLRAEQLHRWVDEAKQAGLVWLGDVHGPNNGAERMSRALRAWVESETTDRSDRLRGDQIVDYARNQHTRLALFAREQGTGPQLAGLQLHRAEEHPQRWAFERWPEAWEAVVPVGRVGSLLRELDRRVEEGPVQLDTVDAPADALAEAVLLGWKLARFLPRSAG